MFDMTAKEGPSGHPSDTGSASVSPSAKAVVGQGLNAIVGGVSVATSADDDSSMVANPKSEGEHQC